MNHRWNWSVLFQEPYFGWLLSGVRWTILVTVCACSIGLMIGTAIGVARTLPSRTARVIGGAYVELFRNVPVLVQLFLWFYVLPELVRRYREAGAGDPGAIRVLVWTHLLPLDDQPPGSPTTGDQP